MEDLERLKRLGIPRQGSKPLPSYRIGRFDPVSGLYEVLDSSGDVIGHGNKIYNSAAIYGNLVRATKPYGSKVWALDKTDTDKLEQKLNPPAQDPNQPPDEPPPDEPPIPATPTNGYPTVPPTSPESPPFTTYNPPKTPTPPNCTPPPKGCKWQDTSIPCNGKIQDYDYAILNTGSLILCCDPSTNPPPNGGCTPLRYACSDGSCYPKSSGRYATLADCQSALVPQNFTGGQCRVQYFVVIQYNSKAKNLSTDTEFFNQDNTVSQGVTGKILSISPYGDFTGDPNGSGTNAIKIVTEAGAILGLGASGFITNFPVEYTTTINNITITRVDNQPDNCGNPKPTCGN